MMASCLGVPPDKQTEPASDGPMDAGRPVMAMYDAHSVKPIDHNNRMVYTA